jgi:coenzyme F420-reducing hydrogenase delta subunit
LEQIGLEPERMRMFNLSSAMAGQFAAAATEMTEAIIVLGPNPLRNNGFSQDTDEDSANQIAQS